MLTAQILIIASLALAPRYAGRGGLTVKCEQQSQIWLQTLTITPKLTLTGTIIETDTDINTETYTELYLSDIR